MKTIFITGAASGIGHALAASFIGQPVKLVLTDIDLERLQASTQEIIAEHDCLLMAMDVTNPEQINLAVAAAIERFGRIDALISNAGVQHIAPLHELEYEDWQRVMRIHLDGAFLTTRACLPHMYQQGEGCVIYMGSVHSKEASPLKAPYVAAKHALLGLCKSVAVEGAEHGVRSHVICPGFVKTPLAEKQIPEQAATLGISEEEVVKRVMLGKTVDTEFTSYAEIAELTQFLINQQSLGLTGQSFMVSHGWHMQ